MATDDASHFSVAPLRSCPDPTQTHIEQLAKLVISIGRCLGTLSSPASRPSLSASSPPFNDICASASSLIMIVSQVSQPDKREKGGDITMLELDSPPNTIPVFGSLPDHPLADSPTDPAALLRPGILMMILACYQRLLEAFETICLFMQQRLQEMEMNSLIGLTEQRYPPQPNPFAQRSRSISPPSLAQPSDTLQFIMMIKLTSDLLSRLDRALLPLVNNVNDSTSHEQSVAGFHLQNGTPELSSSSSSSDSTTCPSSEDLLYKLPALTSVDISAGTDGTGRNVAERNTSTVLSMKAGEQLRQQQSRLHTLIKVVKRLVRSQKI
ncbi:MAG: hypothetical protein Q9165_005160 [Trypethelium subeluteriae]